MHLCQYVQMQVCIQMHACICKTKTRVGESSEALKTVKLSCYMPTCARQLLSFLDIPGKYRTVNTLLNINAFSS